MHMNTSNHTYSMTRNFQIMTITNLYTTTNYIAN